MGSPIRREELLTRLSPTRLFAVAAVTLVVAAVIGGIWLAGSPETERARQFDRQRLDHLQQLSYAIDLYYENESRLPTDLEQFRTDTTNKGYYIPSLTDPKTGEKYGYRAVSELSYELCATFEMNSSDLEDRNAPMYATPVKNGAVRTFEHSAGRSCFTLEAGSTMGPACGLRNPCPSGQSCVLLPKFRNSVCAPTDKIGQIARCPENKFTVDDSYPAKVTCDIQETANTCRLMRDLKTGRVDCFGCAAGKCKDVPDGWEDYEGPKPGAIGIPYACFVEPTVGCQLAQ